MSQLAQTIGRIESQGKLSSQIETAPKVNVSAITLRSGTVVEPKAREKEAEKGEEEEPLPTKQDAEGPNASSSVVQPPFPSRLVNREKHIEDKSILEMFQKVEINMPLLEVIRRIPRTETHHQELHKQMSQLAQTIGRIESQGKLSSQIETAPKVNVSAITVRSGTVVEPKAREKEAEKGEEEEPLPTKQDAEGPNASSSVVQPPFPSRLVNREKHIEDKSILEMFQKVEINMPLLEVIRRIPRYAKFLKDLCTHKKRLTGKEKVNLGEHVSAVFQRTLPPKMKDQGMFAIPCKIGNIKINRAMCDLGASINVMPLSLYNSLSAKPLKETRVTIQLADRSVIYPEGLLENVLVEVEDLIFPADFYVIKMEQDRPNTSSEILLGRPFFLGTANTKIEVRSGLLSMDIRKPWSGGSLKSEIKSILRKLSSRTGPKGLEP
ncbi:hypothetical protein GQ457_07G001400 [Hibiscus cannabinus]